MRTATRTVRPVASTRDERLSPSSGQRDPTGKALRDLRGDRVEQLVRRRAAGDERGDAPQRRLLVEQVLDPRPEVALHPSANLPTWAASHERDALAAPFIPSGR